MFNGRPFGIFFSGCYPTKFSNELPFRLLTELTIFNWSGVYVWFLINKLNWLSLIERRSFFFFRSSGYWKDVCCQFDEYICKICSVFGIAIEWVSSMVATRCGERAYRINALTHRVFCGGRFFFRHRHSGERSHALNNMHKLWWLDDWQNRIKKNDSMRCQSLFRTKLHDELQILVEQNVCKCNLS